jgi:hypothetical protein
MTGYYVAQVNIARMSAPLDGPIMAEFVARLGEINTLADRIEGFIWRLQKPRTTQLTFGGMKTTASCSICRCGRLSPP